MSYGQAKDGRFGTGNLLLELPKGFYLCVFFHVYEWIKWHLHLKQVLSFLSESSMKCSNLLKPAKGPLQFQARNSPKYLSGHWCYLCISDAWLRRWGTVETDHILHGWNVWRCYSSQSSWLCPNVHFPSVKFCLNIEYFSWKKQKPLLQAAKSYCKMSASLMLKLFREIAENISSGCCPKSFFLQLADVFKCL